MSLLMEDVHEQQALWQHSESIGQRSGDMVAAFWRHRGSMMEAGKKNPPINFTSAFFPGEEPMFFFLGRVPYNAGNTAGLHF